MNGSSVHGRDERTAGFSETAREILAARYLRRNELGETAESAEEMFERIAAAIAEPCRQFKEDRNYWYERFLQLMRCREFLPNSPTLMNAGMAHGQLAACFVLPVEDDLDAIFTALHRMARVHQSGGGTGFSFSRLRPRNDPVTSTGGVTSGPLSFMELFDHATAVIRRGGRRRGANMAVLRVDHPDIVDFISAKRTANKLANFNLSVGITAEFWSALESGNKISLRNPRTRKITELIDAQQLFNRIVDAAWQSGEPGLLFLDEIERANPTPTLGAIEATNPCGEQPLLPHESCTLGAINLAGFSAARSLDWQRFATTIEAAVVFLDNVIEVNAYPYPEIEATTRRTRKIGLGVMGFADLLAQIGIPYDSNAAVELATAIARFLSAAARQASAKLGLTRGSFSAFPESVWAKQGYKALRNACLTCIAPTGTISLIAGASPSIEPYFALATRRRLLDGRERTEVNALLENALKRSDCWTPEVMSLLSTLGSVRQIPTLPEAIRQTFPVALEISPNWHLAIQAAFQSQIDAAVSKTVNLPNSALPETVKDIFLRARRLRLKGITVYRYGCRADQPLSLVDEEAQRECRECAV